MNHPSEFSEAIAQLGAVLPGTGGREVDGRGTDGRAAAVLNEGERVAMLIGQGAMGAADQAKEVAGILGCGVAKALNGRTALPDDLPSPSSVAAGRGSA